MLALVRRAWEAIAVVVVVLDVLAEWVMDGLTNCCVLIPEYAALSSSYS